MKKVNLAEKYKLFSEHWSPKIVGELNGQVIKIAKVRGEFVWHKHDDEDEFFLVNKGQMIIRLRDQDIELRQGEFFIVPRGMEHKPIAVEEAEILMFEPAGTLNTGNVRDQRTIDEVERI
jgi:mannose-6-phosphate isomerase-like protein (cupin superfamily)